jgi:hypothetical protein
METLHVLMDECLQKKSYQNTISKYAIINYYCSFSCFFLQYFKYRINLDLFRMLQNFVDTLYWNLSQNLSVKISKQHLKLFMYFRFEGCQRFSLLVLIRKKTLFVPKDLYQYRWWEISLTKKCETVKGYSSPDIVEISRYCNMLFGLNVVYFGTDLKC